MTLFDFYQGASLFGSLPLTDYLDRLLGELRDLMREARHFAARIVLMDDVALCCAHQLRLGARHRLQCRGAVAALDGLLDGTDGVENLGAGRLVDYGAAGDLARRFLGGSRIGHRLKIPLALGSLFNRG